MRATNLRFIEDSCESMKIPQLGKVKQDFDDEDSSNEDKNSEKENDILSLNSLISSSNPSAAVGPSRF